MEIASDISNISIVIPAYFMSTGIMLCAGINAIVMRYVGRQPTLFLAFAAMCFFIAGFQFNVAEYYLAGTIPEAVFALHWQAACLLIFVPIFFFFVARYTGQLSIKPWLVAITLFCVVMLVANFASPYSLRFDTMEMIAPLRLPWGETLARFSGTSGMGSVLFRAVFFSIIFWVLWRSVVQYRRGKRRMALFLAACMALLIAGNLWGILIDLGLIDSFYVAGFAYLGLVLLMSVSLGLELQDRTSRLEASASELRIAATAFETQEAIMVTNANRDILRVNQSFTKITGYSAEEAIGQNAVVLKTGGQDEQLWAAVALDKYWQGEIWSQRKNGEEYPQWCTLTAVTNAQGQVTNYIVTFSDISQHKQAEEQIHNLAFYDPLTKLPNRRLMRERLSYVFDASVRDNHHGAILFIDIDNFKDLNDTKGHEVGDLLLIEVAKRLKACVRIDDTVARLGGDEFITILEGLATEHEQAVAQVETMAGKILTALNQPYFLGGHEYHSSASIGINLFLDEKFALEDLLMHADIAMYQAKSSGRNSYCFFVPDMQAITATRANLETELHRALPQHQFKLYYQMQVKRNGHITGAEVLLRWQHPEKGLVSPAQFITIAEDTGMILPIGQWVLDTACAQLKAWQNDPEMSDLQLAVNVSAKQFSQTDFIERVITAVKLHDIPPALLKLELTESMVLSNVDAIIQKMRLLKEFGVRFSLDDFGTGYSSLSYLKRLPLDQIKIDQSFVSNVTNDGGDMVMIRSIVELGMNFKLEVIAEGVETEEQLKILQDCGCTNFQGYLFSKPVPVEHFERLIRQSIILPNREN
jgi:diguanylate cyclase (GGDEF)-like protein/PAS domain S-box-containing protein